MCPTLSIFSYSPRCRHVSIRCRGLHGHLVPRLELASNIATCFAPDGRASGHQPRRLAAKRPPRRTAGLFYQCIARPSGHRQAPRP